MNQNTGQECPIARTGRNGLCSIDNRMSCRRSFRGMNLPEQIDSDLKDAMRAKDALKLSVLRMLESGAQEFGD